MLILLILQNLLCKTSYLWGGVEYPPHTKTSIICKTETLDSYISRIKVNKLDFIKCDVEGAELLCFKGGINTIKQYKPIICTEMLRKWAAKFNYHPNNIIVLLKDIGYSCFKLINATKIEEIFLITNETKDTNFIFLHKNKHKKHIENLI